MVAGLPVTRAVSVPRPPAGWTRVVFLDVGQGDATLDPAARRAADAGRRRRRAGIVIRPRPPGDAAGRLGLRCRPASGRWCSLMAIPITSAARRRSCGHCAQAKIWDGVPVPAHEPMRRLRARRPARPCAVGRAAVRAVLGARATCGSRVLNPPDPDWERPKVRNDDSIVLQVRIGDVAFILPGDITRAVEPSVAAALHACAADDRQGARITAAPAAVPRSSSTPRAPPR